MEKRDNRHSHKGDKQMAAGYMIKMLLSFKERNANQNNVI